MAAGTNPIKRPYEEFEPFCKWQKKEGIDTLEVYADGFSMDQLRVELNNEGVIRIRGQRDVDEHKSTGFQKEITVSKDVNINEIRAYFSNGILSITMPKQTPKTHFKNLQIISSPKSRENKLKNPEMGTHEAVPKKTVNDELDGKEKEVVLKLEINRRMAECVTVAFALLVAIGVFLMYFRPSNLKM